MALSAAKSWRGSYLLGFRRATCAGGIRRTLTSVAKGTRTPHSHWQDVENRKSFFKSLYLRLGLASMQDWYCVPLAQIKKEGGVGIMTKYYKNSVSAALAEAFPEHIWEEWKFGQTPRGFWREIQHQKRFLQSLYKKLDLHSLEDWYLVRPERTSKFPGALCLLNRRICTLLRLNRLSPKID